MVIRSRAPTRIDFAGGTTDLPAFRNRETGAVTNAAINRYAYCALRETEGNGVRIVSQDLGQFVEAADIRELEFDGNLDLLKAAVRALNLPGGVEITVRCDAPPGSGTGSSASVGVAVLGLLDRLRQIRSGERGALMTRFELAELACDLEHELGIVGGKQDQYAAALGGLSYMQFVGDLVPVQSIEVEPWVEAELEKHLVLCYSGQSRLSGDTNAKMIAAYESGEPTVVQAMQGVARIAEDMYRALQEGDLEWFGELLDEEWQARSQLHSEVVTPKMAQLREAALEAGAAGGKVCGAGGGGCIVFLSRPDREDDVRRALERAGGRILDFSFDHRGLQVWESRG
ncbi:MAG: hypothetical protein J7M38_13195 [Armatimonadetes bacterium]|nr:hypothetical protein [Armatimonadota bacterium]